MRNTILNRKFHYSYWNVTSIFIAINFIMFCLTGFLFPSLKYIFSLVPSYILYRHYYWQFLTYMFTHATEFILYYLLTGVLSGVASYAMFYMANTNTVLLGASGAIYALLMLFSVLYPRSVIYVFGLIPVQAPLLIILYFIIELISGLTAHDGVAHMTHLSGLVFGLLYIVVRMRMNPLKEWRR